MPISPKQKKAHPAKGGAEPAPFTRMSLPNLQARIATGMEMANFRTPEGHPDRENVWGFYNDLRESLETADYIDRRAELMEVAMNDDGRDGVEARNAMANITIRQTNSMIRAESNFASFFRFEDLAHDEEPWIENNVGQEVDVYYLDENGHPDTKRAMKRNARWEFELRMLYTDEVTYPLRDLRRGRNARELALYGLDLTRDMALKQNEEMKRFVLVGADSTMAGSFSTAQGDANEAKRVYVHHSAVDPANFPTSNIADPGGTSTSSLPGLATLIEAIKYVDAWGGNFEEGNLAIREMFIPSKHASEGMYNEILKGSINLNAVRMNPAIEQVFSWGRIISLGGQTFMMKPDNTLTPTNTAALHVYASMNQPLGIVFNKPDFASVERDESDRKLRQKNLGTTWMEMPFGIATISPWAVRMLAIKYRAAA